MRFALVVGLLVVCGAAMFAVGGWSGVGVYLAGYVVGEWILCEGHNGN